MLKQTILFSGYLCDPFDVSEKYVSFIWLSILLEQFNIILLTTKTSEGSINKYYNNCLPDNLKIISFADKYPFKSKKIIRDSLLLGYFFFNFKIKSYLKKHPEVINNCDIIFQRSPESFRYFTSLVHFGKPVYIGPLAGGIKPPEQLKSYFKIEPVLYKLRNLDSFILKLPVYKKQFAKLEKVLVTLDYMDDILPVEYLRDKKVVLLSSGVDCSLYPQAISDDKITNILYVGRLTRYKGLELLIKALNNIKESNFILHILGRGEEQEHLELLVNEFNLSEKVKFHGFKPRDQVVKFFQSASIFCLPTLTEPNGFVFLEAMASGLPIITISNGGPKYICPDEGAIKIPITSESDIIRSLQESISFLIENPKKRKEMGKFNREYCLKNYDWKVLGEKILDFFNKEVVNAQNKSYKKTF